MDLNLSLWSNKLIEDFLKDFSLINVAKTENNQQYTDEMIDDFLNNHKDKDQEKNKEMEEEKSYNHIIEEFLSENTNACIFVDSCDVKTLHNPKQDWLLTDGSEQELKKDQILDLISTTIRDTFDDLFMDTMKDGMKKVQEKQKEFAHLPKALKDLLALNLTDHIIVLIDYENMSNKAIIELQQAAKKIMRDNRDIKIQMLKFASRQNSRAGAADVIVNSDKKDAVDHYISYCVGLFEMKPLNPFKVFVISNDHFAEMLQKFSKIVVHKSNAKDFSARVLKYWE